MCRKRLDETTAELRITAAALEKAKEKTDTLLYRMLPKKVAHLLREGKTVEAGKRVNEQGENVEYWEIPFSFD